MIRICIFEKEVYYNLTKFIYLSNKKELILIYLIETKKIKYI